MAETQKGVNRILCCFRRILCAAEESTCFELICEWRISSYGNISQNSSLYLCQFPFYVRLLESLLENAAI